MRQSRTSRFRRSAAVVAAALLLFPLNAPTASAAVGDLACTGNFQFNFTPPLTSSSTTAAAEVSGGLVDCFSANGSYTRLKSGYRTGVGSVSRELGTAPCAPVMTITEGAVLYWNTGERSKFDITVNTDPSSGDLTISAYFTHGPLAGDTANAYPIVLHPNADCATNGLSSLTSDLLEVFWE
ncbi:hypothetical protein SAMN05192558_110224 [Actinokineospora alba]|uniref:Secreted protein n=1 Tax=Actinokineospora alba TaxID=504798 RepID=A0A1H0TVS4_9PSEU|nr:hypothetical protein [Actinokineospora alba]TDP70743.1 hypothetical protein C8E96_6372 [Actinokineospora alba]SDJ15073.1 hypothetical protein SAMN05421871_110224 [Actinokineospora alba]SDP58044.1 hypothetical protein SAMN05192558_110224 [Actinokineospora alba]